MGSTQAGEIPTVRLVWYSRRGEAPYADRLTTALLWGRTAIDIKLLKYIHGALSNSKYFEGLLEINNR